MGYALMLMIQFIERESLDAVHWYALKVYFNKVDDMEHLLVQEGVECYVPRTAKADADAPGRMRMGLVIPSLMFFRSSLPCARRLQQSLRGKAMVYTRQCEGAWMPAAISDREMNVFRLVVSSGEDGLEYFAEDRRVFHKGERVRVTGGPFAGAEGRIVRVKGNRRLIVSLPGVCAIATSYIPQCFLQKLAQE